MTGECHIGLPGSRPNGLSVNNPVHCVQEGWAGGCLVTGDPHAAAEGQTPAGVLPWR